MNKYFGLFWYYNCQLRAQFYSQLRWMAIFRETLIQLRVADKERRDGAGRAAQGPF